MQPKFKVGEVVILQSKTFPELNGEYVVAVIRENGQKYFDRVTGEFSECEFTLGHFGYVLEDCQLKPSRKEHMWAESALRKKHERGEMDFTALMNSLSQPTKETNE